ncbi:Na(+)-translocating NADH-quinone reductase subunit C [Zeaxanthinibacter enoshimensis]|uniref:Na(+)-translocating NADH-quinone reductase subunit C n=1 Tax=Zeaxanthinibacter enoshimensis TaxID=392009 RepID=A0A4V3D3P0_9FLAO|nr:Na(+)-translocating NADH-quinone reductase subunit C [Zeaxanthinibacter enoshimensis]TDQ30713.1 Na+-transporting NADH:ubiquinone oxidoreductase subunit C [Zeaxanthinibacter enoshimensis]
MAVNKENNVYTVIFAAIMVIVVGAILAYLASSLKPRIQENERFEKQQNILYAMGVNENTPDSGVNFIPTDRVEEEFSKYIKKQLVIEGDKISEDENAYLIDLKKQLALASKGNTPKLPLMIGEKDGKTFYIIPMYGKGLWDAIWGHISLDENMIVQGVYFDHKGETPGLGANIKERYFMDDFDGETILNGTKYEGIRVAKGNNDPLNEDKEDNEVDALAGATITGDGVSNMISQTVKMYKSYLETIRTTE